MTRKVTLSRSEVEMAKHFGVPLEEAAKRKLPKRGRPVGSKNKRKPVPQSAAKKAAVKPQPQVDYKSLAEKLQNALAKSYADYQDLEKDVKYFAFQVEAREAHIEIKQQRIDMLEATIAAAKANAEGLFRDEDDETVEEYLSKI